MRIAIYSQQAREQDVEAASECFEVLKKYGAEILLYEPFGEDLSHTLTLPSIFDTFRSRMELRALSPDLMLTIGGDGTILKAAQLLKDYPLPVAGINLGRLGFLATIDPHHIAQAIDAIYEKNYIIEPRTLISVESNFPLFEDANFALNDFAILKRDTSSMITIHAYIDNEFLNSYWADGLIISTPTGSTGYSLSCGGPIVFPKSGNFVITPVAPHNLNVRPLVISDRSVLSFHIEGRADNFLCTLDSRFETVTAHHQLTVKKADFLFHLLRLPQQTFLLTIRDKLNWGLDKRN